MKTAHPYLNFPGNAEEAFGFYRSVFGGAPPEIVRFRDFPDNGMGVPEAELDLVAHIAMPLGPHSMLMASDLVSSWRDAHVQGNGFYINLDAESVDEAERLFAALSDGGRVIMPLGPTEWAERYAMFADRYGVQWMVNFEGDARMSSGPST